MYLSPQREYRRHDTVQSDEQKIQVVLEESDLWITVPQALNQDLLYREVFAKVQELRGQLKLWIGANPAFRHSLSPLPVPEYAPDIVKRMSMGAQSMGVGPFAAVAGTVAELVARHLVKLLKAHNLPPDVMVENGGDSYLCSTRERVVALLPDPEAGANVGLFLSADDFPLALCASSATIGHSLSFGQGDIAVVRAEDGALADAAATAYGNMLKSKDALPRVLKQAERDAAQIPGGIAGVFLQCQGQIGIWGKMELTALQEKLAPQGGQ